jgi:hypothetical protein
MAVTLRIAITVSWEVAGRVLISVFEPYDYGCPGKWKEPIMPHFRYHIVGPILGVDTWSVNGGLDCIKQRT